jgi:hypothetical protein
MTDDDECRAVGRMSERGTKVLKENLPQCYVVHKKFHMT